MGRYPSLLLPLLLVFLPAAGALAQDGSAAIGPVPDVTTLVTSLGPIGALVWGAYLLGKGVNVTLTHRIEFSTEDRRLLDDIKNVIAERSKQAA